MGCNHSTMNGDAEALPVRLRPLFRQRMDEFRKRRNKASLGAGEEGDLSMKQLLKDDVAEDENETEKKQNAVRVVEKLSKVVPLPDSECINEEQCRNHEQEKVKDIEKHVEVKSAVPEPMDKNEEANAKHEEVFAKHEEESSQHKEANANLEKENPNHKEVNAKLVEESAQHKEGNAKHEEESAKHHDDDDEDEEEEEEEEDDDIGRMIGPGSPSFRIYCVEAEKRKEEEICEKPTTVIHQKSPSFESSSDSESAASASSRNIENSKEVVEVEPAPKRKGHKIKKFGGMKRNLFNVKHLHMNGMNKMMACTGGSNRKSLLSQH